MKLLVLTKRQYTGKDLLDDRYGRLFEIPLFLGIRGHEVLGVALSYRRAVSEHVIAGNNVNWYSFNARLTKCGGISAYWSFLKESFDNYKPDVVWASSDALQLTVAAYFCKKYKTPLVVDLYDNYESFGLTRMPGLRACLRKVCRSAAAITVVGEELRKYVGGRYGGVDRTFVVGNAVSNDFFRPIERSEAQAYFQLPQGRRFIGTGGALTSGRGIEVLFESFLKISEYLEDVSLVLAGPRDKTMRRYKHKNIIDLGVLDHSDMPIFYSALDVAVICNIDSKFGRFCFPQKFYEIVVRKIPVIAAEVGELAVKLNGDGSFLYKPGEVDSLAEKLSEQLRSPMLLDNVLVPIWSERAEELEKILEGVINNSSGAP